MPCRMGLKAQHQRYNPMQIKCTACPRWFKSKTGLTKHYRTYHVAPKAMHDPHSDSPISTPPYTPPLDDGSVSDVHDYGFPSQLEESPQLNLSSSPPPLMSSRRGDSSPSDVSHFLSRSPSSQPSSGHADIVPYGELYGAYFSCVNFDRLAYNLAFQEDHLTKNTIVSLHEVPLHSHLLAMQI
jgi:hypothetical protein